MAGPTVDQQQFYRRLNRLYDGWKENEEHAYFGGGMDAFCVLAGKASTPESTYRLSAVTQVREYYDIDLKRYNKAFIDVFTWISGVSRHSDGVYERNLLRFDEWKEICAVGSDFTWK